MLDEALGVLERTVQSGRSFPEWRALRPAIELAPERLRLEHPRWAALYAQALANADDAEAVLTFTGAALERHTLPEATPLLVKRAWALTALGRPDEALALLEHALPHLEGALVGEAWRRVGLARFQLEPNPPEAAEGSWLEAFQQARQRLEGHSRGLGLALNDEGACLHWARDTIRARLRWVAALEHLRDDPYYLATTHYNLGVSFLAECRLEEAERHLLEAERLTRASGTRGLRARALCGVGALHRVAGDWARAEEVYRQAFRVAREPHDRREALLNLGRTLRLAARPLEALGVFERLRGLTTVTDGGLAAESAAALLIAGAVQEATEALGRAARFDGADLWLSLVVRAEAARRSGSSTRALEHLAGVPVASRLAREERRAWPELFALAAGAGLEVPEPIQPRDRVVVRVEALGPLRVRVDGQPRPISPTGRVGELLVVLLELKRSATHDQIVDRLWPNQRPEEKRNALGQLARKLRVALGWPTSVRAERRVLRLDPQAYWSYDVEEARRTGRIPRRFLEGIYSDWVEETAQELGGLVDADHGSDSESPD